MGVLFCSCLQLHEPNEKAYAFTIISETQCVSPSSHHQLVYLCKNLGEQPKRVAFTVIASPHTETSLEAPACDYASESFRTPATGAPRGAPCDQGSRVSGLTLLTQQPSRSFRRRYGILSERWMPDRVPTGSRLPCRACQTQRAWHVWSFPQNTAAALAALLPLASVTRRPQIPLPDISSSSHEQYP